MTTKNKIQANGLSPGSATFINMEDIFAVKEASKPIWTNFGLTPHAAGGWALPQHVVALQAADEPAQSALIEFLKTMGVPSKLALWSAGSRQALYRLSDPVVARNLEVAIPDGIDLIQGGGRINLPANWEPSNHHANSVDDLTELTIADIARIGKLTTDPVVTSNPLLPFSLRGQSERFRKLAVEARPLLGDVCLRGQVTIWYAAPGTGKTLAALSLVIDAVREARIAAGNVFYVNADDNGQGFATKLQIMDDLGGNTLAPGFKGFKASELIVLLHKMADRDEARGVLVIIDTIKKFASLMDKRESTEFAQACRRVAMMGGTVLGLAHTTKNGNSDGTPRYAGTSDLVDDADAAYTLRLIDAGGNGTEKVVEFRCFKSRGDCADTAAYAFAAEKGVSYEEKLASVRIIDPMQVDEFKRVEEQRSDTEMIDAVIACIREGVNTKMLLAKEVATRTGISGRAAGRLVERYTGEDPVAHRWNYRRADRGAQVFQLLQPQALAA